MSWIALIKAYKNENNNYDLKYATSKHENVVFQTMFSCEYTRRWLSVSVCVCVDISMKNGNLNIICIGFAWIELAQIEKDTRDYSIPMTIFGGIQSEPAIGKWFHLRYTKQEKWRTNTNESEEKWWKRRKKNRQTERDGERKEYSRQSLLYALNVPKANRCRRKYSRYL